MTKLESLRKHEYNKIYVNCLCLLTSTSLEN